MHKSLWELFDRLDKDPKPHLQIEVNSNMGVKPKLVQKLTDTVKNLKKDGKIRSFKLYTLALILGDLRLNMPEQVWILLCGKRILIII